MNSVFFVLASAERKPERRLTAFHLIGPTRPEEKDALLREPVFTVAREAHCRGLMPATMERGVL
ncbi:MAG: hypothetical protein HYV93_21455 [Candidatus Rokubacteria bacterium]|nr:hypothetical protein [Candidatus Rokubacteria bacterium]